MTARPARPGAVERAKMVSFSVTDVEDANQRWKDSFFRPGGIRYGLALFTLSNLQQHGKSVPCVHLDLFPSAQKRVNMAEERAHQTSWRAAARGREAKEGRRAKNAEWMLTRAV